MIEVLIEEGIRKKLPEFALGCVVADVVVEESPAALKERIVTASGSLTEYALIDPLWGNYAIYGTREAYKALGKEPSRYRPSAEALHRRILQGKGVNYLYNVVDLLNLLSIQSGYSIGGWDLDQIQGPITVGIGKAGEPYETIGRGPMNIEGFPVVRDRLGAFGNPTADSKRTMVTLQTKRFLMGFYAFEGAGEFRKYMESAIQLLQEFAQAKHIETKIYTVY